MDMRKMTQEMRLNHWLGILQERNASVQSIRKFCHEQGINEKSYYYWQHRLREKVAELSGYEEKTALVVQAPSFAEIAIPTPDPTSKIIIRIGNAEIEIQGSADTHVVESIIKNLC